MKRQEFEELLIEIENGSFSGNTLSIRGIDMYDLSEDDRDLENINDEKAILLSNVLKKNPNITKVILINNNIQGEGALALNSVDSIIELNLSQNPIHLTAAIDLIKNTKLKILNLEQTPIGSEIQEAMYLNKIDLSIGLMNSIINNTSLIELNLSYSHLPQRTLDEVMQKNKIIKIINFDERSSKAIEIHEGGPFEYESFIPNLTKPDYPHLSYNDAPDPLVLHQYEDVSLKITGDDSVVFPVEGLC